MAQPQLPLVFDSVGFDSVGRRILGFPIRKRSRPLTHGLNYRSACDKRTGSVATYPLDLCHGICLQPPFSALRASSRLAASIHRYTMMVIMRHHGDEVDMTSQPIAIQTETSLPSLVSLQRWNHFFVKSKIFFRKTTPQRHLT